ncbi:unnamed protein product [Candida verbasci]|uniref:Uncharacterized protein n=1 Tax=Candida verbasci TaxID=1227364 RepID=A0A9W4TSC8_9ASCO|nr:unnamed protein product [Candida verbasci]
MIKNPKIDSLIRERLTNSYFSILKNLKNPEELGNKINAILSEIDNLTSQNILDEDYLLSLFFCVSEIGNSCIYDEDELTEQQLQIMDNYWRLDQLGIRMKVLQLINKFAIDNPTLSQNTLVTETCCSILKSGLNETVNGPFKFDLSAIYHFIVVKVKCCNIPSSSHLHKLIQSLILTNFRKINTAELEQLINETVFSINLDSDLDLVGSSIEIFNEILETNPGLIIYSNIFISQIIPFCLKCFEFNETYIVKQLVKFWTLIIVLKKGNLQDHQHIKQLMIDGLGFNLINNLISSFINAPRSNLDYYYPVFKHLIGKYPMEFKSYLTQILSTNQYGKVQLNQSDSKQFISKLIVTRGSRTCNDILKDYWLKVNKLIDYT